MIGAWSVWSGWVAAACVLAALSLPIVHRVRHGRRAAPSSPTMKVHVALGFATSGASFAHTLVVLPSLGSPEAIGGGMLALAPAGAAFFLLIAHTGIGLQLRNERLKARVVKRRIHVTTATAIVAAVATHVYALLR